METFNFNIFKHYFEMKEKLRKRFSLFLLKKKKEHRIPWCRRNTKLWVVNTTKSCWNIRIQDLLQISAMPFQVAISILFFALFDIYFTSQFPVYSKSQLRSQIEYKYYKKVDVHCHNWAILLKFMLPQTSSITPIAPKLRLFFPFRYTIQGHST